MCNIRKRLKNNQNGQVAIFVLMMFSLIFMFFGMAINVGMLVHHKMNLQNAADLAALAGAAEQGRILNMIGWKNYELRKNYKDFVYRIWIQFNDRHAGFPDPRDPTGEGVNRVLPSPWTSNVDSSGVQNAPSYCLGDQFAIGHKACEITRGDEIANSIIGPPEWMAFSTIEPISAALIQLTYQNSLALTAQADQKWMRLGLDSRNAAWADSQAYWDRAEAIYNTYLNPNFSNSIPYMMNHNTFPTAPPQAWQNFTRDYTNNPVGTRTTRAYTSPMTEVPHNFHELARLTAYKNLNANLRSEYDKNPDAFFRTITPQGNLYVDVRPMKLDFTVFYTTFPTSGLSKVIAPDRFNPVPIDQFNVGVTKARPPDHMTFYGVMLKSQPELPFMPGATPWELTAVGAAKPFGNRIGPQLNAEDFLLPMYGGMGAGHQNEISYPALPYVKLDETRTIDDTSILYELKAIVNAYEDPAATGMPNRLEPFLKPNQWDAMRYNFPAQETSTQPIHPTDHGYNQSPFQIYPVATAPRTGWSPEQLTGQSAFRAGYSIKLIPLSEIYPYVEQEWQQRLETIQH